MRLQALRSVRPGGCRGSARGTERAHSLRAGSRLAPGLSGGCGASCRSGGRRGCGRAAIDAGDEGRCRVRACSRTCGNERGVQCSRASPPFRFTALHFFSRYKTRKANHCFKIERFFLMSYIRHIAAARNASYTLFPSAAPFLPRKPLQPEHRDRYLNPPRCLTPSCIHKDAS